MAFDPNKFTGRKPLPTSTLTTESLGAVGGEGFIPDGGGTPGSAFSGVAESLFGIVNQAGAERNKKYNNAAIGQGMAKVGAGLMAVNPIVGAAVGAVGTGLGLVLGASDRRKQQRDDDQLAMRQFQGLDMSFNNDPYGTGNMMYARKGGMVKRYDDGGIIEGEDPPTKKNGYLPPAFTIPGTPAGDMASYFPRPANSYKKNAAAPEKVVAFRKETNYNKLTKAGYTNKEAKALSQHTKLLPAAQERIGNQEAEEYRISNHPDYDRNKSFKDQGHLASDRSLRSRVLTGRNMFMGSDGVPVLGDIAKLLATQGSSFANMTMDANNQYVKPGVGNGLLNLGLDATTAFPSTLNLGLDAVGKGSKLVKETFDHAIDNLPFTVLPNSQQMSNIKQLIKTGQAGKAPAGLSSADAELLKSVRSVGSTISKVKPGAEDYKVLEKVLKRAEAMDDATFHRVTGSSKTEMNKRIDLLKNTPKKEPLGGAGNQLTAEDRAELAAEIADLEAQQQAGTLSSLHERRLGVARAEHRSGLYDLSLLDEAELAGLNLDRADFDHIRYQQRFRDTQNQINALNSSYSPSPASAPPPITRYVNPTGTVTNGSIPDKPNIIEKAADRLFNRTMKSEPLENDVTNLIGYVSAGQGPVVGKLKEAITRVQNAKKGQKFIGSESLSSDSYPITLDRMKSAVDEGIADVRFHGYQRLNGMGFPEKAGIPGETLLNEFNSKLTGLNSGLKKKIPMAKLNDFGSVLYPQVSIVRKKEGGMIMNDEALYMEDGGEVPEGQEQEGPQLQMVNIEKGEILIDPVTMEVLREYTNPNRYKPHAKDANKEHEGNFTYIEEGKVVIPKKYAKRFKGGDRLTKGSIILEILKNQKEEPQETTPAPGGEVPQAAGGYFVDGEDPVFPNTAKNVNPFNWGMNPALPSSLTTSVDANRINALSSDKELVGKYQQFANAKTPGLIKLGPNDRNLGVYGDQTKTKVTPAVADEFWAGRSDRMKSKEVGSPARTFSSLAEQAIRIDPQFAVNSVDTNLGNRPGIGTPTGTYKTTGDEEDDVKVPGGINRVAAARALTGLPTALGLGMALQKDPYLRYDEPNLNEAESYIEAIPTDPTIEASRRAIHGNNRAYNQMLNNIVGPSTRADVAVGHAAGLDAEGKLIQDATNFTMDARGRKLQALSGMAAQKEQARYNARGAYREALRKDRATRQNMIHSGASEFATNMSSNLMQDEQLAALKEMFQYVKLNPGGKTPVADNGNFAKMVQTMWDQGRAASIFK